MSITSQEYEVSSASSSFPNIVHTLPYLRYQWAVQIDSEIGYAKIFRNKCAAIDFGRETAIINRSDHWIFHSDSSVMVKESYEDCVRLLNR